MVREVCFELWYLGWNLKDEKKLVIRRVGRRVFYREGRGCEWF